MKKQRVYIAGPITGLERQAVIDRFALAERQLTLLGFRAVNPARHLNHLISYGDHWSFWMRLCIAEMMTCSAIFLLDGWEASRGARLEHKIARELGLAILRAADTGAAETDQPLSKRNGHNVAVDGQLLR